jgi:eukaryotic-like serine/threonine-protein kinase
METSKPVEKVSRYEITGELGKGAMGRVYKAVDPTIGRTVALKTMRLDVHGLETDEMLRRFKNEARLAGVLNHGNIVTIYDAGEQDGLFYIAMEYIEGITLHGVLNERKTLSPEEIINISKQICAGLDHAHHHGVIHRDVKPANIMLEPDGTAKIMDFGIAKSGGGLTSTGQVLGTPNYMAPEQVRGHALDGRTDLFSFGVMLYEMTTGEKPFAGTNVTTIIYKIIHENPVPPRELDVTIHPGLDKVIMKALAKKPEERYQTGAELARELQNYKSLGANTDSTQEIPSSSFPAATGAAPGPAAAKSSAKPAAAAPALVASSTPKPRKMQPPPPSMKKIGIGVAVFVALVAVASVGVWKGTITRDHSADNPVTTSAPPVAATTQPAPVETTPTPAPEVPARARGKAKKASVAALPVNTKQLASVAEQPSTQTSGTGDLKLSSTPDGAAIQIDGRNDPSMSTPYTALRLAPGPHDITFIKSGYLDEKRVISVAAGRTDFVAVTMQKAPVATSQVTINSDPGGAEIWVDGKSIGRVTPAQAVVVAGQHEIVLRKPGYEDSTNPVTLVAGQPFSLSNNLKSLTPASPGSAFGKFKKIFGGSSAEANVNLTINSTPAGAAISLNGKDIGQQTPFTLPLAPGKYDIALTLAGHQTVRKSIKIEKNKPAEINEALPAQ